MRRATTGGMEIEWDVPIEMDDGIVLRADVFRPSDGDPHPVILTYGPYAKGLAFQEGYPDQWRRMVEQHPDVAAGSSNVYQNWEVVDPEKWVPEGYVCVRVDSRGAGRSPGFIDHFSPRETADLAACYRLGGGAAVVIGQGRSQRDLLLRDQPVARRIAPAAGTRGHVRLGGRRRLVPGHDPPRRHRLHVLGELVRHAGEDRPARVGRPRSAPPASPVSTPVATRP